MKAQCRKNIKPPLGQLSACSMVKCWPQVHKDGRLGGFQPYRKQRASLKAPLWREKPCSAIGNEDNQLEAPFQMMLQSLSAYHWAYWL